MDEYDDEDASATAAEDWAHDSTSPPGAHADPTIWGPAFYDSMFELADVWTTSIDAAE
jgi:hypothetical protein